MTTIGESSESDDSGSARYVFAVAFGSTPRHLDTRVAGRFTGNRANVLPGGPSAPGEPGLLFFGDHL